MRELIERLLQRAVEIQQIPAPTFQEARRSDWVYRALQAEGLQNVSQDASGNVLACLPGSGAGRPLAISAHLDTVFPPSTDLSTRREEDRLYGPGIGDNSLGVAGLFGVLWGLREAQIVLPGDLWLIANVAEEGLGNSSGMRTVVNHFLGLPASQQPAAYIVLEGLALGQVYHRALGSLRYRVSAHTAGGHSWVDYGAPSAVHELTRLAARLAELPIPQQPRASLNIGVFQGGTSVNVIANQAWFELDLRAEEPALLQHLVDQAHTLIQAAARQGVEIKVEEIGRRPTGELSVDSALVRAAIRAMAEQNLPAHLTIGSTDASIPLSLGLPAVCVGLTTGGGAHTPQEFIRIPPLEQGMAQLLHLVQNSSTQTAIPSPVIE